MAAGARCEHRHACHEHRKELAMLLVSDLLKTLASKKPEAPQPASTAFPPNLVGHPSTDVVRREFRHLMWTDAEGNLLRAPVEVVVTTRLERTAGKYLIGDLVYTLSLLPGEEVRLFTTDRRTQFSLDSQTNIGYRTATTFEDQMYMSSMDSFFGQLSSSQWAHGEAGSSGSFQAHGEASGAFESFFSGPDADMNGSFNTNSFADFVGGMSAQASSAHHVSATATNTASAVSVGAVGIRSNVEGKLDTHVEMNYRSFRNPSRTRAVTFYFFQIRRAHTLRFLVDSITVSSPERAMWRMAKAAQDSAGAAVRAVPAQPANLSKYADFKAAHAVVTQELANKQLIVPQGLGYATPELVRTQTSFNQEFTLPTPGLFVRGGRDAVDVADPSIFREFTQFGGVLADEFESLGVSFIERLGSGIVPAVMNTVVAAQAIISGANASIP
jgi:hypothetical protein